MKKLKLQMQMSADGFVSTGPDDEQKWVTWAWEEIRPHVLELLDTSDTILIGRKLAVDYIPYWQDVNRKPDDPMHEVAERIVKARKIVFTKTLNETISPSSGIFWENTELAKGNLAEEVDKLKKQEGKDLIVYGGTSFVSALLKAGLIDDLHLFVNPVAIGKGESIFSSLDKFTNLKLKTTTVYNSGIVLMNYETQKNS